MRTVRAADQPTFSPQRSNFRDGGIHFTPLHRGTVGDLGYFTMAQVRFDRYYTPRHRHNYEQIRFGLQGRSPIGRNLYIEEGEIAYHPEGTHYGPQDIDTTVEESPVVLAWQFGGPSLQGFYPASEFHAAYQRLSEAGRFEQGVYITELPDGTEQRQDGYEAAWSEYTGRPLTYPPSRYRAPVLMKPESFGWYETADAGVATKLLGTFGDAGLRIWMLRIDPGATAALAPWSASRCGYLLSGSVRNDASGIGDAGDLEDWGQDTAWCWDPHEAGALRGGAEQAEVLLVDLPDLGRRLVP
jgi:hypothetical protein